MKKWRLEIPKRVGVKIKSPIQILSGHDKGFEEFKILFLLELNSVWAGFSSKFQLE